MSDINQKRRFVSDLYPGEDWKQRVAQMPEYQIIAIYLRTRDNPLRKSDSKPSKEDNENGPLTLF